MMNCEWWYDFEKTNIYQMVSFSRGHLLFSVRNSQNDP
ncbi:hypothetical protein F652_264 [Enterobacteriaceae bacterium bta3-1]|nr:hypothetical protein F652_264 [Enterobacteriaceae bacterium bta3-1]